MLEIHHLCRVGRKSHVRDLSGSLCSESSETSKLSLGHLQECRNAVKLFTFTVSLRHHVTVTIIFAGL